MNYSIFILFAYYLISFSNERFINNVFLTTKMSENPFEVCFENGGVLVDTTKVKQLNKAILELTDNHLSIYRIKIAFCLTDSDSLNALNFIRAKEITKCILATKRPTPNDIVIGFCPSSVGINTKGINCHVVTLEKKK